MGWLIDNLDRVLILIDLGPLGLYEDIDDIRPRARDLCTSYATKNTDYLITSSGILFNFFYYN